MSEGEARMSEGEARMSEGKVKIVVVIFCRW